MSLIRQTLSVEPHQRRILGRVADEIDRYRDGRLDMQSLLNNAWGLFTAAELCDAETRDRFLDLFYAVSNADDARQPWMPAGLGSEEDVETALYQLETWTRGFRDGDPVSGVTAGDEAGGIGAR